MSRETSFGDEQFRDCTSKADFEINSVFVIMSFSPKNDDVYSAIKDECKKIKLRCIRVDDEPGSGLILRKIFNLIEKSEFIIVDLSDERPNVYYELGYAHGVGNEEHDILLVAQKGTKLHFDIAPLCVHFYSSTEHLREIVNENLKRMIKLTR